MLLPHLVLLIDVTFSTPTPVIASYFRFAPTWPESRYET
jgi:hypothetical protein